jgi:ABC-type multidrug transport system fused ATPase/permease subunit
MELESGTIVIDGVDISKIDLATLRSSRITVTPQKPAFVFVTNYIIGTPL